MPGCSKVKTEMLQSHSVWLFDHTDKVSVFQQGAGGIANRESVLSIFQSEVLP